MGDSSSADGFILVKRGGGRKNKIVDIKISSAEVSSEKTFENPETTLRKIQTVQNLVQNSEFFTGFCNQLDQILDQIAFSPAAAVPDFNEKFQNFKILIVCYGLGSFSTCPTARYQLGLLLCLEKYLKEKSSSNLQVELFDPVFSPGEIQFLESKLLFKIIDKNEEGKRRVDNDKEQLTLFYLPHCSHQLTNNLIWANWPHFIKRPRKDNEHLRIIIISNSFSNMLEKNPKLEFIKKVSCALKEFKVINNFQFLDIFNDTAIHFFPIKKLENIKSEDEIINEPNYDNCDEIIRNKS